MKSRRTDRASAATAFLTVLIAALLVVAPAATASGYVERVSGSTPRPGQLERYATGRYHATTGTISMSMNYVAPCGGSTALGLRNTGGAQFTTSPTWTAPSGTKYFGLATTGSQRIPGQVFYISARMTGACFVPESERYFSGTLVF